MQGRAGKGARTTVSRLGRERHEVVHLVAVVDDEPARGELLHLVRVGDALAQPPAGQRGRRRRLVVGRRRVGCDGVGRERVRARRRCCPERACASPGRRRKDAERWPAVHRRAASVGGGRPGKADGHDAWRERRRRELEERGGEKRKGGGRASDGRSGSCCLRAREEGGWSSDGRDGRPCSIAHPESFKGGMAGFINGKYPGLDAWTSRAEAPIWGSRPVPDCWSRRGRRVRHRRPAAGDQSPSKGHLGLDRHSGQGH
jgi:hypothetical protein